MILKFKQKIVNCEDCKNYICESCLESEYSYGEAMWINRGGYVSNVADLTIPNKESQGYIGYYIKTENDNIYIEHSDGVGSFHSKDYQPIRELIDNNALI